MGENVLLFVILVICIWLQCLEMDPRSAKGKKTVSPLFMVLSSHLFFIYLLPSIALRVYDLLLLMGHKKES